MESLLLDNEDNLDIQWMPYDDLEGEIKKKKELEAAIASARANRQGIMGAFGTQGIQGVTGTTGLQGFTGGPVRYLPRQGFPDSLSFTITFKKSNPDLSDKFEALLPQYKEEFSIINFNTPIHVESKINPEFQDRVDEISRDFYEKEEEINRLFVRLRELGVDFDRLEDSYCMPRLNIPDIYKLFETVKGKTYINIKCSKNTEIYRVLERTGLLEKYCPKFYRDGDPYSVGNNVWHKQPILN